MLKSIFILFTMIFLSSWAHSQDYQNEIAHAEFFGKAIYKQDQAAWVATDELLESKIVFEKFKSDLKGWVSYPDPKGYKTVFIARLDGIDLVVFEVLTNGKSVKSRNTHKDGRQLTDLEAQLLKVRLFAAQQKFEYCKDFLPMNSIVLPIPNDPESRFYAYLFSATRQPDLMVLGKHYRFIIDKDATQILDKKAFSNSCFAVPVTAPKGVKQKAAFATHLMANYPQEHHVFASLSLSLDLYIVISATEDIWKISRGKISAVKQ